MPPKGIVSPRTSGTREDAWEECLTHKLYHISDIQPISPALKTGLFKALMDVLPSVVVWALAHIVAG